MQIPSQAATPQSSLFNAQPWLSHWVPRSIAHFKWQGYCTETSHPSHTESGKIVGSRVVTGPYHQTTSYQTDIKIYTRRNQGWYTQIQYPSHTKSIKDHQVARCIFNLSKQVWHDLQTPKLQGRNHNESQGDIILTSILVCKIATCFPSPNQWTRKCKHK